MNSFRLLASERDIDEAAKLLRSKGECFINVLDPVGNQAGLRLNTRPGTNKGYKYIELDFYRSGCDFSDAGQLHFKALGYKCGPRVIAVETMRGEYQKALDQMLNDIFSADESSFKKI